MRVWLQCEGCPTCGKVHQWEAVVRNLTRAGKISCPCCQGKKKHFCSCQSVAANKHLLAEWHEDNPSPAAVSVGSHKELRWRCSEAACRHVWTAKPHMRFIYGQSCRKCLLKSKAQPSRKSKSKAHAPDPRLAATCPDLAAEWDEKNNVGSAAEAPCGSSMKASWLCKECTWSWQARVGDRACQGSGCPRCQKSSEGQCEYASGQGEL